MAVVKVNEGDRTSWNFEIHADELGQTYQIYSPLKAQVKSANQLAFQSRIRNILGRPDGLAWFFGAESNAYWRIDVSVQDDSAPEEVLRRCSSWPGNHSGSQKGPAARRWSCLRDAVSDVRPGESSRPDVQSGGLLPEPPAPLIDAASESRSDIPVFLAARCRSRHRAAGISGANQRST